MSMFWMLGPKLVALFLEGSGNLGRWSLSWGSHHWETGEDHWSALSLPIPCLPLLPSLLHQVNRLYHRLSTWSELLCHGFPVILNQTFWNHGPNKYFLKFLCQVIFVIATRKVTNMPYVKEPPPKSLPFIPHTCVSTCLLSHHVSCLLLVTF